MKSFVDAVAPWLRDPRVWRGNGVPRFTLASLPEETFGHVTGRVEPLGDHVLVAPLSGRRCVYYSYVIEWPDRRFPSFRYREALIEEDDAVSVIGSGVREPDPQMLDERGYRERARSLVRMAGSPRHPLLINDDPKSLQ
jgi:hypothetical protein